MAAMEHGSGVQAYLDVHKIPKLFEDLLSKIVKQQPSSPFDFLISTLQTMKHSTTSNDEVVAPISNERSSRLVTSSARTSKLKSPSINTERRGQQTTGSARSSKLKSPHVSSERRGRQMASSDLTSKLKVEGSAKGQTTGSPKATTSLSPSIPKTPPASKMSPLISSIPKTSKSAPRQVGSKLRPPTSMPTHPTTPPSTKKPVAKSAAAVSLPSKLPGATKLPGAMSSKLRTPQTAAKGSRRTTGDTAVGRGKTSTPASSSKPKAKVLPHTSTSEQTISQHSTSQPGPAKQVPALAPKPVPLVEDINEFFGAGKEASTMPYETYSDEEDESPVGHRAEESSGETDEEEEHSGGGEGRGGVSSDEKRGDIDLERIIEQRKSSKRIKQTYLETLLAAPIQSGPETTPPSEGYFSEAEEGEDGDEGEMEMVEDFEALEEEGVSGSRKNKYVMREVAAVGQAVLDLKMRICARCARVVSGQDGVTSDSMTEVHGTQPTASEVEFESVSHVGSNVSFPEWNASSGSEVSGGRFVPTDGSEVSSDVTLQSESTWGGLAPPPRPPTPSSEEESAVQLPPPPPLPDQPWPVDTPTSRDPYGWGQ